MISHKNIRLLIEHAVEAAINESFRGFNFKKFKNLSVEEKLEYAKKHLPLLGQGSSRVVFGLGAGKVLKVVRAEDKIKQRKGFEQNKAEVELYTNPKTKPIITPIYDAADDFSWLITEPVKEFTTKADFREATGISHDQLIAVLQLMPYIKRVSSNFEEAVEKFFNSRGSSIIATRLGMDDNLGMDSGEQAQKKYLKIYNHPITQSMLHLFEMGLHPPDVAYYKHWGKTVSGKVVLMDYGATTEILKKYY